METVRGKGGEGKAGRLRYPLKPRPVNIIIHLKICPKLTSQEKT